MRVSVDTERCVGGGQCVVAAPQVFDQNDDDGTVVLLAAEPAIGQYAAVRQAAQLCPALAITVEDYSVPRGLGAAQESEGLKPPEESS